MSEGNFENIETIIEDAPDIAPGANGKAEVIVRMDALGLLNRFTQSHAPQFGQHIATIAATKAGNEESIFAVADQK